MFAFLFESVGGGEWLVLLAVVLIVVGPRNLPSAARKMGKVMSQLRRAADEFKRQIMSMDEEMKRVGNDLKKEYVDVPESSAAQDVGTETAADAEDYGEPYPGNMPEDYYGDGSYDDGTTGDRAETESAAAAASGAEFEASESPAAASGAESTASASSAAVASGAESTASASSAAKSPREARVKITVSPLKKESGKA